MIEKWFSTVELPLTFEQFWQLPRNPAYKFEYFDGHAWLTPRPKSGHALLDLQTFAWSRTNTATQGDVTVRALVDTDWERLPPLFAAAFHRVLPFANLDEEARLQAAEECLQQTREGTEGPIVDEASIVAAGKTDDGLVGALLITLTPGGDPTEWDCWRWTTPPPPDATMRRTGRPHLTWVFVSPWHTRSDIGTTLLDTAVGALVKLGYSELASTFLLGNESSTLWHWRAGFRLLPHPGSMPLVR